MGDVAVLERLQSFEQARLGKPVANLGRIGDILESKNIANTMLAGLVLDMYEVLILYGAPAHMGYGGR